MSTFNNIIILWTNMYFCVFICLWVIFMRFGGDITEKKSFANFFNLINTMNRFLVIFCMIASICAVSNYMDAHSGIAMTLYYLGIFVYMTIYCAGMTRELVIIGREKGWIEN